jgi:hypothetical protein
MQSKGKLHLKIEVDMTDNFKLKRECIKFGLPPELCGQSSKLDSTHPNIQAQVLIHMFRKLVC